MRIDVGGRYEILELNLGQGYCHAFLSQKPKMASFIPVCAESGRNRFEGEHGIKSLLSWLEFVVLRWRKPCQAER